MSAAAQRGPVLRPAVRELGRSLRRKAGGLAPPWRLRDPRPDRLLFAPQDLRTADAVTAEQLVAGVFAFGGELVETGGASPLGASPPSPAWSEALLGFGWLRHLRAADTAPARDLARALVADAIGRRRRLLGEGPGRETAVVARRLLSFLAHSPLVLTGADRATYQRYLRALGRDAAALERDMRVGPKPLDRLVAASALACAALACGGLEGQLRRATRRLSAELEEQIGLEGGHASRDPGTLVALLLDLLPLRLLYPARGLEPPPALHGAIERMLPALRFLRHGNGDLAAFNGAGATPSDLVSTVLSLDRDGRTEVPDGTVSGYERLVAGGSLVLVDAGSAPPLPVSQKAGAGPLSFEFSRGPDRVVVNRGAPPAPGPDRQDARETPSHSTLALDERSAAAFLLPERAGRLARSLFARLGSVMLRGPVVSERVRNRGPDGGPELSASHDGYAPAYGVLHHRRLRLAADGLSLDGEDSLRPGSGSRPGRAGRGGRAAALLRFHLHPSVQASLGDDAVRLRLRSGEDWLFRSPDGRPDLQQDVVFAVPEGRRATLQIVLPGPAPDGKPVRWRFERAPDPSRAGTSSAETAPFP